MFVSAVIMVLLITAALKFQALSAEDAALGRREPVVPFLSVRQLMLGAALAEVLLAAYLWPRRHQYSALETIVWFATVVLCYRVAAWAAGATGPCPCLGKAGVQLAWAPGTILGCMFFGSLALLAWARVKHTTEG